MRGILTVALCAAYLAFGSVADLAHVHGASGHHQESRGLHLDHGHVAPHQGHSHPHGHRHGAPDLDARHVDHHLDDAVDYDPAASRTLEGARALPAVAPVGVQLERPVPSFSSASGSPSPSRDPPGGPPPRPRAPPA